MTGLVIREPKEADLDALTALWKELVEDHHGGEGLLFDRSAEIVWRKYVMHIVKGLDGDGDGDGLLVAEEDGEVSGYILYRLLKPNIPSRYAGHIYISDIVVKRERRRRGIASAMLSFLMNSLGVGPYRVFLRVPSRNLAAVNFYAKHGFKIGEYVMEREIDED